MRMLKVVCILITLNTQKRPFKHGSMTKQSVELGKKQYREHATHAWSYSWC